MCLLVLQVRCAAYLQQHLKTGTMQLTNEGFQLVGSIRWVVTRNKPVCACVFESKRNCRCVGKRCGIG